MQFFPTTDEDFQYFRAQGYAGSINDMHFKAMGDLGYTGALTDRIHAYLVGTYGSYHEAMRDLRNGTSVFSLLSAYGINFLEPGLVLDFASEYYRTSGADTTLASATTYTGASNGTMTDSDGLIKWKPHNLLPYSLLVNGSGWTHQDATLTLGATTAPDGTSDASSLVENAVLAKHQCYSTGIVAGVTTTYSIWAKANTRSEIKVSFAIAGQVAGAFFDLLTGVVGAVDSGYSASIVEGADGWYLCSVTFTPSTGDTYYPAVMLVASGVINYTGDGTSGAYLWGAHVYRSDLGGMTDNPSQPAGFETYVPTTSAAAYLPRTGNHVYNGTAWVNEGLLLESEARTNLVTYSEDFTDVSWSKDAVTVTAANSVGPDGLTSMTKMEITDTTLTYKFIDPTPSFTIGANYATSYYVKYGTQRYVGIRFLGVDLQYIHATYDLVAKTVTQTSVGSTSGTLLNATIEDVGNDILRLSLSGSVGSNSFPFQSLMFHSSGTPTLEASADEKITGTAGDHIWVYGAQFEAGATPSSYIPTTAGATVTRAAETLTVAAANMPAYTTAVSIQMDGRMTYADTGGAYYQYLWQLDGANRVRGYVNTFGTYVGRQTIAQEVGNVEDQTATAGDYYSPSINVPFNIAARHGSTFINGAVDGTALTADLTPTALPDLSATDFDIAPTFMGNIGGLRVWADDLGDTGIAEASAPSLEPSLSLIFDGSSLSFTVLDWSE